MFKNPQITQIFADIRNQCLKTTVIYYLKAIITCSNWV